jgi:hypothetical protein
MKGDYLMRIWSMLLVIAIAASGLVGCGKSETSSGGSSAGQAAVQPEPTADPHPPLAMLNTPGNAESVANATWCTGWAIDDSGISQVTGTIDDGAVVPAKIGMPFPGVKEAYPNIRDNDKGGFMFLIPDLPSGPHTLKVQVTANDGGKIMLTRIFSIK